MSDYATQMERACGAGYSSAEAKMLVGHSLRLEADIDDLEPAGEIIEQLASHCAQLIHRLKATSASPINSRTLIHALERALCTCDAFEHLYARAKASDKHEATRLLNQ
jgi:hypothetical protein